MQFRFHQLQLMICVSDDSANDLDESIEPCELHPLRKQAGVG